MPLSVADIALLSRLFDEAQALTALRRDRWLDELPAEHRHLEQPLRKMLAETDTTSLQGLLSGLPALGGTDDGARAGERVGAYQLLRTIGIGGMGSVWLAERADGNFERQVALKLPRLAWHRGLADRMARERQIGALLEHPHIARLYDAGVDDQGRPFIAMAYIDGEPIDTWCERRGLLTRARLTLYLQVVRAVGYAHGRLVIHRDLKPANVLVDKAGQAHLLDFGIAKLLDDAAGTGAASFNITRDQGAAYTPNYAAPEQIAGEPVGVTADVYSLGVMLYELLSGGLPFAPKRRSAVAIEDAILRGDPPLASSCAGHRATAKALRGDVDAILTKAIRRDPGARYATAEALADDIERHLNGEPVKAQPDSTWYRTRKAIVRHRFGVLATVAVAVAVLAGGTVALLQARHAARQFERARIATDFVAEMFKASTEAEPTGAGGGDRSTAPLLDHAGRLIHARFATQPDVQAELYGVVGRLYADLGASGHAAAYAARQVALLSGLPEDLGRLVRAHLLLADGLRGNGRLAAAEDHANAALRHAAGNRVLAAEAQSALARVHVQNGRNDEAFEAAAAVEQALSVPDAAPTIALAWASFVKASVLSNRNQFDAALAEYRRAMDLATRFEGPRSPALVEMQLFVARRLVVGRRVEEARGVFDMAVASLRTGGTAGAVRAAVAEAEQWMYLFPYGFASYDETVAVIEKSRAVLQEHASALPSVVTAQVAFALGRTHFYRGEFALAEPLIEAHASELFESNEGPGPRFEVMKARGMLAMFIGRHAKADELFRAALRLYERSGRTQQPAYAEQWSFVALNLSMQGRHDEAEEILNRSPSFDSLAEDSKGAWRARIIPAMQAFVRLHRGDVAGALERYAKIFSGSESDPSNGYAEAQCAGGQYVSGLKRLQAEITAASPMRGPLHPELARLRAVAGLCAMRLGDRKQAAAMARLSREAFIAQPDVSAFFKVPLDRLEKVLGIGHAGR